MFRGKESSNNRIISISSGLIEFWCFGLPAALERGQVDGGHLGAWGFVPTHTCMHAHARTHTHTRTLIHVKKLQMATDMEASMFSMFNMHVHACMRAWDTLTHTHAHPYPHTPICHPPGGWTPGIT